MSSIKQPPSDQTENAEIYESPDVRLADTYEEVDYNPNERISPSTEKAEFTSDGILDHNLRSILKNLEQRTSSTKPEEEESMEPQADLGHIIESKEQKLQRLKFEFQNLKAELSQEKDDVELSKELNKVEDRLMKVEDLLQPKSINQPTARGTSLIKRLTKARSLLDSSDISNHRDLVGPPPELVYSKEVAHTYELESRINALEALLGPETQRPADVPEFRNFGSNLSKTHELMKLLADPSHLDYVTQRLRLVNAELEQLSELQENLVSEGQILYYEEEGDNTNKQVDQCLGLFDRIEPLIQQVPMLVGRLKTMGSFHNEALDMVMVLSKLQKLVDSIHVEATSALDHCSKAKESLKENVASVEETYKFINDKLSSLEHRMDQLALI